MSKNKATQKINKRQVKQEIIRNRTHMGLVFASVIVVMIVAVLVITFWGGESEPNLVVTPDNVEDMIAAVKKEERTPIGSYEVSMNSNWRFEDGKSVSENASVENSVRNNNMVYFIVRMEDTGEEIYKSPYIPVGSKLANIKLDQELKKGKYNTILTYYLVDNSYKIVSEVSVGVVITIEK